MLSFRRERRWSIVLNIPRYLPRYTEAIEGVGGEGDRRWFERRCRWRGVAF